MFYVHLSSDSGVMDPHGPFDTWEEAVEFMDAQPAEVSAFIEEAAD